MSSLYSVSIDKISKNKVEISTDSIHPDAGPIPKNKTWAMQVLVELYWRLRMGYLWEGGSAKLFAPTEEEQKAKLKTHPMFDSYTHWEELWMGKKLILMKADLTRSQLLEIKKNFTYEGRKFGSYSTYDDRFEASLRPEYQLFINEAERMILSFKVTDLDTEPPQDEWSSISEYGTIEFEVADENMLFHLREGMSYETASYDITYEV